MRATKSRRFIRSPRRRARAAGPAHPGQAFWIETPAMCGAERRRTPAPVPRAHGRTGSNWRSGRDSKPAGADAMLKHFDHVTIVVRDVERAKTFFGVLGFKQAISTVIAGEPFASYMGVPGIEAEHVTLVLENASPRTEIQLLRYRHPQALPDPNIGDLHKVGFNHGCFA